MGVPKGWTDDMNIELRRGTVDELVDFVLAAELAKVEHKRTIADLQTRFGLSPEDADLAWDRVLGGIVRAATRNAANCPDRAKDPMAWTSFQRAVQDPSIVARLRP